MSAVSFPTPFPSAHHSSTRHVGPELTISPDPAIAEELATKRALLESTREAPVDTPEQIGDVCKTIVKFRLADLALAVDIAQDLVNRLPNNPNALTTLGTCLASAKRLDEALDIYGAALRIDHNYPRALNGMGHTYVLLGEHAKAVDIFRYCAKVNPQEAFPHSQMASIALRFGRTMQARIHMEDALRRDPDLVQLHLQYAELEVRERNPDAALPHVLELLNLKHRSHTEYGRAASVAIAVGEYDLGLSMAERAYHLETAGGLLLDGQ